MPEEKDEKEPTPEEVEGEDEDSSEASEDAETSDDEEGEDVETSLEVLLQRKERKGRLSDEEDDEEALLQAMEDRDARSAESLTVKVVPPQPTEFTCRGCFLLKDRVQLKDAKRMLCADCA